MRLKCEPCSHVYCSSNPSDRLCASRGFEVFPLLSLQLIDVPIGVDERPAQEASTGTKRLNSKVTRESLYESCC